MAKTALNIVRGMRLGVSLRPALYPYPRYLNPIELENEYGVIMLTYE